MLLATVTDPYMLVAVQLLDGVAAAVFGVMVPLVVADVSRGTGRFNLSQGIVGTATGIGASLSTRSPDMQAITSAVRSLSSASRESPPWGSCWCGP